MGRDDGLPVCRSAGLAGRQEAQCSFSYVTPELAVQAESFFLVDEMPDSGTHARCV